ncbi:MAG TPA: hypothetical protein VFV87_16695 [Pirellulaceae bacterium]|nr:hypothetical protein [Pirellulaceae bacterium]
MLASLAVWAVMLNLGGDSAPLPEARSPASPTQPTPPAPNAAKPISPQPQQNVAATQDSGPSAAPDRRPFPVQALKPVTPEPAEPEPKRYTWTEIEKLMDDLREQRKTNPRAVHELHDWYQHLSDPKFTQSVDYPQHFERLATWRTEVPDSSTRLVVLARAYIDYAWRARGSGFAYTVTDQGWELFHVRVSEARRLLDEAVKLGVKDGEAYSAYITVAKAEGFDTAQARLWLKEGQRVDPTYYEMYASMAEYLLPRWHGGPGDVERFAAEVAAELPGDDGAEAFGQIAFRTNLYENPYSPTLFWGGYDRRLLARSADVIASRYPDSRKFVNFAALCAYVAQDREVARRIRPLIGEFDQNDGIWLWKNSHDGFLHWCEGTEPGGEECWLWAPPSGTMGMAFHPDGKRLWIAAQFGSSAVDLLDLGSGRIEGSLPSPGGTLNQVAFDDKRQWIVTSFWREYQGFILWDNSTFDIVRHPTAEQVRALAIHPEKPEIAWAESKTVRFMNTTSGEVLREWSLPGYVHELRFSDDGSLLAVKTNKLTVFDAASGEVKHELSPRNDMSRSEWALESLLRIDSEGRLWATQQLRTDASRPHRLARSTPDGKSWEVVIPEIGAGIAVLSPDRRILAVRTTPLSGKEEVTPVDIWDVPSARRIKQLPGHWNDISKMVFSADGKRLATVAGMSDIVKIWLLQDDAKVAAP